MPCRRSLLVRVPFLLESALAIELTRAIRIHALSGRSAGQSYFSFFLPDRCDDKPPCRAIFDLWLCDSVAARAGPPLSPPRRPRVLAAWLATLVDFVTRVAIHSPVGISPITCPSTNSTLTFGCSCGTGQYLRRLFRLCGGEIPVSASQNSNTP